MNQLALSFPARLRTARKLGAEAGQRAAHKASTEVFDFEARALDFIVAYVREHGEAKGEHATLAAVASGIRPKDQRSFGPIYQKAIRAGLIHIVALVPRVRGHGSAGGKLYRSGKAPGAI